MTTAVSIITKSQVHSNILYAICLWPILLKLSIQGLTFVSFDACTILLKAAMAQINSDKIFLWKPSFPNDHPHRQIFGKWPVKFLTFELKFAAVKVWIWPLLCTFMPPRERFQSLTTISLTILSEGMTYLLCDVVIYYSTLAETNDIIHSKEDPGPKDECNFPPQYFFYDLTLDTGIRTVSINVQVTTITTHTQILSYILTSDKLQ